MSGLRTTAKLAASALGFAASAVEIVSAVDGYIDRKEAEANYRDAFLRAASATIDALDPRLGARDPLRQQVLKMLSSSDVGQTAALVLGVGGNTGQGEDDGWSRAGLAGSLESRETQTEGVTRYFRIFMNNLAEEMRRLLSPEMSAAVAVISLRISHLDLRLAHLSAAMSDLRAVPQEGRSPQISLLGRLRDPKNDVDLLQPYSLSTKFIGAAPQQELKELFEWLNSKERISVSLVSGGAGSGKTRLAIELCLKAINEVHWRAGFLEGSAIDDGWRWGRDTLIVIDYAADRADAINNWLKVIARADDLMGDGPKLRVLAMEREIRPGTGWHARAFTTRSERLLAERPPLAMKGITGDEALQLFNDILGRKGRGPLTADQEKRFKDGKLLESAGRARPSAQEGWGSQPLFIMMAGLVADRSDVLSAFSLSRTDLAYAIARKEWEELSSNAAHRAAAISTIMRGMPVKALRKQVVRDFKRRRKGSVDANAAVDEVCQRLAGLDADACGFIEPDIIGEAFVLGVVERNGFETTVDVEGSTDARWLFRALSAGDRRMAPSQFAIRTAQDFAHEGDRRPVDWLIAIAEDADLERLTEIANELPDESLSLREAAADLTRRIVELSQIQGNVPILAMSLNNLSVRLGELGRREEGLAAIEQAVEVYRELAAKRPDAFLPALAMSLNNLSVRLGELGSREEGLAAIEEAVEAYRRLATKSPDAFLPDLASSLNNLSVRLGELGRRVEGLEASEEAVGIRRELAAKRPNAFLPDLASSLNNLSVDLGELGRRAEGLEASEEAVEIRRELAAKRPDSFLPGLAMSLNNLSVDLGELGHQEEALAASEEAADVYRELAKKSPAAFLPNLASSLNNLGVRLGEVGRREEALAAIEEAVEIRRELAKKSPAAFLPNLASALNNLGVRLGDSGRREEGLAAIEEAVEVYRELAAKRPGAFLADLAMSLNNLSVRLGALRRREEGLAAIEEAVEVYRELAAKRADAYLPDLAMSQNTLAVSLGALGRGIEAIGTIEEAVKIYRQLATRRPALFTPRLQSSLRNKALVLRELGRDEEALAAEAEADALDQ